MTEKLRQMRDLPDELGERIRKEKNLILEQVGKYEPDVAINILHIALMQIVDESSANVDEVDRAFKALDTAREKTLLEWRKIEDEEKGKQNV